MQFWFYGLSLKNFPLQLVDKHVHKYCEINSSCWVKSSRKFSWFAITGKSILVIWSKTRRHMSVQSVLFALQCFWIVCFWQVSESWDCIQEETSLSFINICPESTCSLCVKMALLSSEQLCSFIAFFSSPPQNLQVCLCSLFLLVRIKKKKNPATMFAGHILQGKATSWIFGCSW